MDRAEAKARSLARYQQEHDWFAFLYEAVDQIEAPEMLLQAKLIKILLDSKTEIVDCVTNNKPFIGAYYCTAPELFNAMDLPWFMIMETPFLGASAPYLLDDLQGAEELGLGTDLCTAIRLPMYYIESGLMPVPTAIVGLLSPCDGTTMLQQVLQHNRAWKDVPLFSPDPPYTSDERAINYFANELRQMASFLEEHTQRKLDLDRLREVCEESNKVYSLWQEYNELRRAVPCPHGWEIGGAQAFAISQCFVAGDPKCTAWFRQLVEVGEDRVREGKSARDGLEERIRLLWFDIMPYGWIFEFMPWLEEEWGAVLVMDMFSNFPYTLIDTSSEETILHDLAKRNLMDVPMVRQARGTAENFSSDIVRIVRDYKIDCVIWPGHMGHKDGAATAGIMRETCRDIGVPFLHIGLDLFDQRYTSVDEVKNKVSQFFTAMGLG
ncbi:MAG: 2-hydroxyacyl-CoA dehydratase subunit D [Candidatus Krumholzibacteriia bacterium]